jgi:hypothetical protein
MMTSSTVCFARSLLAERVLGDADLFGIVTSMLARNSERGSRAARNLCLTSKSVLAAVLAPVQRVRMDAPLPVLQQMASLASLHVGPGTLDSLAQLLRLTRLRADRVSSPQALSAIMQLTRLQELRLGNEVCAARHLLPRRPQQAGH